MKALQVTYVKDRCLQLNYWTAYPSVLVLGLGSEGIQISHTPELQGGVEWVRELSVLMDQVVKRHRMQRLRGLTGRGVIRDRLQLVVGGEACVEVDVRYFSGEIVVYVMGKREEVLSEAVRIRGVDACWLEIEETVQKAQVQSVCRSVGRCMVEEPLRFYRMLYCGGSNCSGKKALGYLDMGSILPTDVMGHIIVFALRLMKVGALCSELVGYNETEEEYVIPIASLLPNGNLKDFIKHSITAAKEKILLLRVPIMLLAKPQI